MRALALILLSAVCLSCTADTQNAADPFVIPEGAAVITHLDKDDSLSIVEIPHTNLQYLGKQVVKQLTGIGPELSFLAYDERKIAFAYGVDDHWTAIPLEVGAVHQNEIREQPIDEGTLRIESVSRREAMDNEGNILVTVRSDGKVLSPDGAELRHLEWTDSLRWSQETGFFTRIQYHYFQNGLKEINLKCEGPGFKVKKI